ncbi:MAG: YbeD family protein [Gammaproteobacteria bacterium]
MSDVSPPGFPLEFPLKVMGRDTREFHDALAAILMRHLAPLDTLRVAQQPSREGRFVSVTIPASLKAANNWMLFTRR